MDFRLGFCLGPIESGSVDHMYPLFFSTRYKYIFMCVWEWEYELNYENNIGGWRMCVDFTSQNGIKSFYFYEKNK